MSQGFRGLRFLICICLSAYLFISLEVQSILTVIIIIMKCVIYLLAASETPGCEKGWLIRTTPIPLSGSRWLWEGKEPAEHVPGKTPGHACKAVPMLCVSQFPSSFKNALGTLHGVVYLGIASFWRSVLCSN